MIEYVLFVIGIFLLVKGADFLIDGSSSIAKKFGVSSLMIGFTIVAFGTSMPELMVNIFAAIRGSSEVAFGNIIGSNIANLLLVLGVVAIMTPVKVENSTIWKGIPLSILAAVMLFAFSGYSFTNQISLGVLTRLKGFVLLCFFGVFIYYTMNMAKKDRTEFKNKSLKISGRKKNPWIATMMIVGGLIGLYFGGQWVVNGAVSIARQFGMSEYLISATIIAVGTSLPELATGIAAAKKKDLDLAVGNAVGSNIFNIFWVLGFTALIAPIVIPGFIGIDLIFLIFASLLLFAFLVFFKKRQLERWQGFVFILLYIGYILFLILRG